MLDKLVMWGRLGHSTRKLCSHRSRDFRFGFGDKSLDLKSQGSGLGVGDLFNHEHTIEVFQDHVEYALDTFDNLGLLPVQSTFDSVLDSWIDLAERFTSEDCVLQKGPTRNARAGA